MSEKMEKHGRRCPAAVVMFLFMASLAFAGCGSDEVISVSDLGKNSETTAENTADGTDSGSSDSGNASADSGTDDNGAGGSGSGDSDDENGVASSGIDTAELVGTWDESTYTYTNTVLNLELPLSEGWTADTSTEGGIVLNCEKDGLTANAEFVFDIGGAYATAEDAWDAYYEYMNMDEDTLLLLAASAYAVNGTDVIGGKEFTTLTMSYETDNMLEYRYVAIGEVEECATVIMFNIETDESAFETLEAAQNATQELVEILLVW